jgi:fructokinase
VVVCLRNKKPVMQTPMIILGETLMDCIMQPNGSFIPHEGGSPYNVARAIALQGGEVTFFPPISSDDLGNKLRGLLLKDGVKLGMPANHLPTSLAVVSVLNGQPSYQFYREGVADRAFSIEQALAFLDACPMIGILHTGSLALIPPEADKTLAIIKAAKARGWTISCDINLRPRLARDMDEYRATVLHCMAAADWLKASDEDLVTLLDSPAGAIGALSSTDITFANAPNIANAIASIGCQRIALTFGGEGALMRVGHEALQSKAPNITVVDTVGAGDTFWGSCLLAWARGETQLATTMNLALKAAAINCTRAGCNPPSAADLYD